MRIKFKGSFEWPDEDPPDDRETIDHQIGGHIVAAFLAENDTTYDHTTGKFFYKGIEVDGFDEGTFGWKALGFSWEVDDPD